MRKLNKFGKCLIVVIAFVIIICAVCLICNLNLKSVSNDTTSKEFIVENGDTYLTLSTKLKKSNLIRSELFYKLYIKTHKVTELKMGKYTLNENMSVKAIIKQFEKGSTYNPNAFTLTIPEGKNIRYLATLINKKTDNSEDDFYNTLSNKTYIQSLINKYWFLTTDIQNKEIYYSLEGYLFPDTYEFKNKSVTVKEIIETMLNQTNRKLEPYKNELSSSKYNIHEIITLASIVELEGSNSSDRAGVADVFYNRLENGWSLGSDVTTYYAAKVDMSERELYAKELNDINAYNTRSSSMAGKLPIGPICNPGIESIKAAINPTKHDYFYFVADKNKKTYFTKTESEHKSIIAKLKKENLWYEY